MAYGTFILRKGGKINKLFGIWTLGFAQSLKFNAERKYERGGSDCSLLGFVPSTMRAVATALFCTALYQMFKALLTVLKLNHYRGETLWTLGLELCTLSFALCISARSELMI